MISVNLFKHHQFKPIKRLGQHFLTDRSVLKKIVRAADLQQEDMIVEVGPGPGALTFALAPNVKTVIAVEKDKNLAKVLKERLAEKDIRNVEVVENDILKFDPKNCPPSAAGGSSFGRHPGLWPRDIPAEGRGRNWKLIGNIPYYITARLIRKFLELQTKPALMVLMVQKEVAQRIIARPPDMSILAVAVQFYATPSLISVVSKTAFTPCPKVDSAIIRIIPKRHEEMPALEPKDFFRVVKAGFSGKRKQLVNTLSRGLTMKKEAVKEILEHSGIDPRRRAESVSMEEWITLTKEFLIPNF